MTKLSKIILGLLFIFILTITAGSVFATDESNTQSCTTQTYEVDADEDNDAHLEFNESGGKVEIIFNDLDGALPSDDDRDQVIVNTGTGYEIVNVQYELEHYSGIGWITVPGNNPTTTITLAGTDDDSRIDEVEVKLKTICLTPTVSPTETITPTPTPTSSEPTPTPPGDGLNDKQSDGRSSCPECTQAPQGQVLGASVMAGTGTFEQNMMNFYMIFGMFLLFTGYVSYIKEKTAKNK